MESNTTSRRGRGRKLPTPGGPPGAQKTASLPPTRTPAAASAAPQVDTAALDAKVAELTMSLEVVQKGTDAMLERAVAAESKVAELESTINEKQRDVAAEIGALKRMLMAKDAELAAAASSSSTSDSATILQLKIEHSASSKAAESRGRKRMEEKDALFAEMKAVKESEIAVLKDTIGTQERQVQSKTASLQGQMAALQGELQSVKSFTAEQNKFVSNLGEENQKLVGEIKRLKEQAKVRDQQLQESVYLARDAIVREKKKREEWVMKMKAGQGGN